MSRPLPDRIERGADWLFRLTINTTITAVAVGLMVKFLFWVFA